jgi:hypothetical protein
VRLSDTKTGLRIAPQLAGLPTGDHGFHIHANPDCGPGKGPPGRRRLRAGVHPPLRGGIGGCCPIPRYYKLSLSLAPVPGQRRELDTRGVAE